MLGGKFRCQHFVGREAGGWEMTTVWDPDIDRLLASVAEMEGADDVKAEVEADDGDGANQGDEAEESPSHKGAMRARGEVSVELQGVRRLSARSSAPFVQGVRWGVNLRARSSAL